MRKGGGKAKGSAFERKCCKLLSMWVSQGQREDLFWRSSISGGRATVARNAGKDLARHAGDISSTHPDGHKLTDFFLIECKHVRELGLHRFILGMSCPLRRFWDKARTEATSHNLLPMIIAQENGAPETLVVVPASCKYDWVNDSWVTRVNSPRVRILIFDDMLRSKFSMRARP